MEIKQNDLAEYLGAKFTETLREDLKKEVDEKEYMSQKALGGSCRMRAYAILFKSILRVWGLMTYFIIRHREGDHGEDHREEMAISVAEISTEDLTEAKTTRRWWKA